MNKHKINHWLFIPSCLMWPCCQRILSKTLADRSFAWTQFIAESICSFELCDEGDKNECCCSTSLQSSCLRQESIVANRHRNPKVCVWRGRVSVEGTIKAWCLKPVLNWANVCSPEHTSDTSTNYDSFLNWTFSSPNMVRTVQTLLHSQLACNEMQASARTCGRRAADSMIENVG